MPVRLSFLLAFCLCVAAATTSALAKGLPLEDALKKVSPAELIEGADGFGPVEGEPPIAAVMRGQERLGVAFLNEDFADATGYSGRPIYVLLSIDNAGTVRAAKLIEHHEPIVLVGIPEAKLKAYLDGFVGRPVASFNRSESATQESVEVVSGATVTVMVIQDSVRRAARLASRRLGVAGAKDATVEAPSAAPGTVDTSKSEIEDWVTLTGDGSIRRRTLQVGEVSDDFKRAGKGDAGDRPESAVPEDTLIDLYVGLASVPSIGRTVLGDAVYERLAKTLAPGQQAIVVAGNGLYSFKGSGYVRGGIFDRIQLVQGDLTVRFRDRDHTHLGAIEAAGAPRFHEIGLFVIPKDTAFDPTQPWRVDLLVQRAVGPLKKEFLSYSLSYTLPERFIARSKPEPVAASAPGVETAEAVDDAEGAPAEPLWRRVWRERAVDIGVLSAALLALTGLFFFQDWFARRPKLLSIVRVGFLLFSVGWIGGYAHAQLSVVNVLTFSNALITGFKWDYFLIDPLIFVLWISVAASLLFWGRGAFCGWLCPFGAAQELLNKLAKLARVPQLALPWWLHERLWPVKYVIFLGLLGYSLYSLSGAEAYAEVEPFKTAAILRFSREWWFVLYAGGLLGIGLFVERFFCRYICPLGGALAIPGKLRIFEWLRRYKECGTPCQRCATDCMVQAIHEDGHINPNECLYCLHCQTLYHDSQKCPHMIRNRHRRERLDAMAAGFDRMVEKAQQTGDEGARPEKFQGGPERAKSKKKEVAEP